MAKNKKEQYRLNIDALYGTDINKDRYINLYFHKKRKRLITIVLSLLISVFLCSNLYLLSLNNKGYVFATGEKMDGNSYIGLITKNEIMLEQQKSLDELTYDTLQVTSLLTVITLPLTVIFFIFVIILLDKRNESQRAIIAKKDFDRIQNILKEEAFQRHRDHIQNKHLHAPNILED